MTLKPQPFIDGFPRPPFFSGIVPGFSHTKSSLFGSFGWVPACQARCREIESSRQGLGIGGFMLQGAPIRIHGFTQRKAYHLVMTVITHQ
jgi:hypothetical protein